MSRMARSAFAIGLFATLAACFTEPVAERAGLRIDPALLGHWHCTPLPTSNPSAAILTVLRLDPESYFAELRSATGDSGPGKDVARCRAYLVKAKGLTLLSVEDLDPGAYLHQWSWTAVRYSVASDGALVLLMPAKRFMLPEESALEAFRRELDQTDAWQPFTQCRRLD